MIRKEELNPTFGKLSKDILYHLGLNSKLAVIKTFSDVKFVCMGGTNNRAEYFIRKANRFLGLGVKDKMIRPIGNTDRYILYKAGPILSVSHGIGASSLLIVMNEILKLLEYAGAQDVEFFRMGTSGGVGVEPGTFILSENAWNKNLKVEHDFHVMNRTVSYPSSLDNDLNQRIINSNTSGLFQIRIGDTYAADDFYEGQGRMDGAFNPGFDVKEQKAFLDNLAKKGILNIEMESTAFAAVCKRAGIPAAILCATLVDRLESDQIEISDRKIRSLIDTVQQIIISYIRTRI